MRTGLCLGMFFKQFWPGCWGKGSQQLPARGGTVHRKDESHRARAVRSQTTEFHSTSAASRSGYGITSAAPCSAAPSTAKPRSKRSPAHGACVRQAAAPGPQSPGSPSSSCWASAEQRAGGFARVPVCPRSFPATCQPADL